MSIAPEGPTIPDIINPNPDGEQGVFALPRCAHRLVRVTSQELVNLVCQRLNGGNIWRDEVRVDSCPTIGKVVGKDQRFVVHCGLSVDPIWPTGGRGTLDVRQPIPCDQKGTDGSLGRVGCREGSQ